MLIVSVSAIYIVHEQQYLIMDEKKKPKILRDKFIAAAKYIKGLGYKVYVATNPNETYGYYSDGNNVAYFQQSEFQDAVNIATCNKVPGSFGAHHILEPNNRPVPLDGLPRSYLENGFQMYPPYFTEEDKAAMPVNKWINLHEFLASPFAKTIVEL